MGPVMEYYEKSVEDTPVFYLQGAVAGGAPLVSLCGRIMELADGGERYIILELADVTSINDQSIGMLLSCVMRLRRAGGDLCFAKVDEEVMSFLQVAGIETLINIYDSTDDAINYMVFSRLCV